MEIHICAHAAGAALCPNLFIQSGVFAVAEVQPFFFFKAVESGVADQRLGNSPIACSGEAGVLLAEELEIEL